MTVLGTFSLWVTDLLADRLAADGKAVASFESDTDRERVVATILYEQNVQLDDPLAGVIERLKEHRSVDVRSAGDRLARFLKWYQREAERCARAYVDNPTFDKEHFFRLISLDDFDKNDVWSNFFVAKSAQEVRDIENIRTLLIEFQITPAPFRSQPRHFIPNQYRDVMALGDSCWKLTSPSMSRYKEMLDKVLECIQRNEKLVKSYREKDSKANDLQEGKLEKWTRWNQRIVNYIGNMRSVIPVHHFDSHIESVNSRVIEAIQGLATRLKDCNDLAEGQRLVEEAHKLARTFLAGDCHRRLTDLKERWRDSYRTFLKARHDFQWMNLTLKHGQASMAAIGEVQNESSVEFESLRALVKKRFDTFTPDFHEQLAILEGDNTDASAQFKLQTDDCLKLVGDIDYNTFMNVVLGKLSLAMKENSGHRQWRKAAMQCAVEIVKAVMDRPKSAVAQTFDLVYRSSIVEEFERYSASVKKVIDDFVSQVARESELVKSLVNSCSSSIRELTSGSGVYCLLTHSDLEASDPEAAKTDVPEPWIKRLVKDLELNGPRVKALMSDTTSVGSKRSRREMEDDIALQAQQNLMRQVTKAIDQSDPLPISFASVCELVQRLHLLAAQTAL